MKKLLLITIISIILIVLIYYGYKNIVTNKNCGQMPYKLAPGAKAICKNGQWEIIEPN